MRTTIFLLFTCLLFSATAAHETDSDELLRSDVNQDGIVNILDLTYIASQFSEIPTKDQPSIADINSDGIVNILDLSLAASLFGKYSGIPITLTGKTYDNLVLKADIPILVEFKSDS